MPQSPDGQPQSDYPELKLPPDGWKSNIPPSLLTNVEPQMVWLMEQMSKNTQATEWTSHAAMDTNQQVRKTNGRLKGAESTIISLQADVEALKAEMKTVSPITTALNTARLVLTNKIFLVILAMSVLFLLGFNRDIMVTILKALFG